MFKNRKEAVEFATAEHEAYLAGDNFHRLSPTAHARRILTILNLDEGMVIEAEQLRVQCGLPPLDTIELALAGTLQEALKRSREEIVEQNEKNQAAKRAETVRRRAQYL